MLLNCNKCGNDFLTEADVYIVNPVNDYEASCNCELIYLKAEVEYQKLKIKKLRRSIKYLTQYGNNDCTAMAYENMLNNTLEDINE